MEPVRHLEFDIDEGTWLSVSVSPDGNSIVFDLLGDIYTMPASGGETRRIRGGMAYDAQPVFSPDGYKLAFVSDESGNENLWIADANGGNPRMLSAKDDSTRFSSPSWSADGTSVYVSQRRGRHGVFELWLYHLQGGNGIRVPAGADDNEGPSNAHLLGANTSRDGRYLYVARKSIAAASLYSIPAWHIARRDLRSGVMQNVVTSLAGALRPVISPDGRRLVYGMRMDGETGLRFRDLESGEDRWIAYPIQRDNADSAFNRDLIPGYAFTSDGRSIIAAWGGKIRRIDIATGAVAVLPFSAHVRLGLGPSLIRDVPVEEGPVRARVIQQPSESPDGREVAFSAFARIYIMNRKSGEVRALTNGTLPAFQPAWSADGRWITYVTWTASDAGHVWRVRRSGGQSTRLTQHAAFFTNPVFSSDGNEIFALRSSNTERMRLQEEVTPRRFAELVSISVDGKGTEVVTHTGTGAMEPFVTDVPDRVYYTTTDGVVSVLASGRDGIGTDLRTHVRVEGLHPWANAGRPHPVDSAKLSPDGRWLLTIVASQLHLLAAPPGTESTPVLRLTGPPVGPRVQLSQHGADYFGWANDGKTIVWSVGATYFRRDLATIDFEAAVVRGGIANTAATESINVVVELPRDKPQGSLVLRGATVITMNGDEVVESADILIEGNRIAAVGARDSFPIPLEAMVKDLGGVYIVPGFVDTHAHWYEVRHDVLDLQNWSFLSNLAFGVTSGLDVQAMDQDMFAYQDLIDAGLMTGPRVWSVGQGIFWNNAIRSAEHADEIVHRYTDYYRTSNVKSYLVGNRRQRQWMVQASLNNGAMATTEGNADLKLDITHAIDGFAGNEHQLPVVPVFDDVVRLFAETKIGYTPTLMIIADGDTKAEDHFFVEQSPHDDPKVRRFMPHFVNDTRTSPAEWVRPEERMYPRIAESAAKILRAGGRVGIGSHAEFQGVAYHWEMQALASGGLTPHEVLRAATDLGSQIIGRSTDIGTIENGKLADLVILGSNPLDDIRNTRDIQFVIKNGRLYDGDTLDEVWPRTRKLAPLWHQEVVPTPGVPGSSGPIELQTGPT